MSNNVLEIRSLDINYPDGSGEILALRDINLSVTGGSVVGIVGESGCGKSTLISSILQLPMDSAVRRRGQIVFNGFDVCEISEKEMVKLRGNEIAMVFQDPFTALNPVLTVGQQLIDVQHRQPGSRIAKRFGAISALQQVGIDDAPSYMRSYPHQLSGGMLQRACIAMALLVRPKLLIADEPTTALDAVTEVQILELLKDFQERTGAAVIIVSHHLNVIAKLCQKVLIMYAGEVVEEADTESMFAEPLHPYTKLLIQSDPARVARRQRRLPSIPGRVAKIRALPQGCTFSDRCPWSHPRCDTEVPTVSCIGTRQVRCHLYSERGVA